MWRDPKVWVARMNVEKVCASSIDEVMNAWKEGRKIARARRTKDGSVDVGELVRFWMWGVWNLERGEDAFEVCLAFIPIPHLSDIEPLTLINLFPTSILYIILSLTNKLYQELLRESKAHPLVTTLHTSLLLHYIQQTHPHLSPSERRTNLGSILLNDFPSSSFFRPAFTFESSLPATSSTSSPTEGAGTKDIKAILQLIFERWRMVKGEEQVAGRAWAEWLVRNGLGDEASRVVRTLVVGAGRRSVEREELERWWNRVLHSLGGGKEKGNVVGGGGEGGGVEGEGRVEVDDEGGRPLEMLKTTMEVDEDDVIWL